MDSFDRACNCCQLVKLKCLAWSSDFDIDGEDDDGGCIIDKEEKYLACIKIMFGDFIDVEGEDGRLVY